MHQILPAFIADLNFWSEFTYPAFSILATLVPTSDKQVLYRLLVMRFTIYLCDTYSKYRRKNSFMWQLSCGIIKYLRLNHLTPVVKGSVEERKKIYCSIRLGGLGNSCDVLGFINLFSLIIWIWFLDFFWPLIFLNHHSTINHGYRVVYVSLMCSAFASCNPLWCVFVEVMILERIFSTDT